MKLFQTLVTANKYDCVPLKKKSVLHLSSYISENMVNTFTCLSEIKQHIMRHQKLFPCQVFYLCFLIVWVFFHLHPIEHCYITSSFVLTCSSAAITFLFSSWWFHLLAPIILFCYFIQFYKLASANYLHKWRVISLYTSSPLLKTCSSNALGNAGANSGKEWHNHKQELMSSSAQGQLQSGKSNTHKAQETKKACLGPNHLVKIFP